MFTLIDQCQTTDEFLQRITEIRQSWAIKHNSWAYVGDDFGRIVCIHEDNIDKSLFKWNKGKVIPLPKK